MRTEAPDYMEALCPAHSRFSVKRCEILGAHCRHISESEAHLVYTENSRPARATQCDRVSRYKNG